MVNVSPCVSSEWNGSMKSLDSREASWLSLEKADSPGRSGQGLGCRANIIPIKFQPSIHNRPEAARVYCELVATPIGKAIRH